MIDLSESKIIKFICGEIGNEGNKSFSGEELTIKGNEEESSILKKIFLQPFASSLISHEFHHEIDLELNVLFKLSKSIYEGINFASKAKDIWRHLKSVSIHPGIKEGDLFIAKIENVKLDNKYFEALGVYKIENKENFIETSEDKRGNKQLFFRKGITGRKLDKACLVIFTKKPYSIFVIDNVSNQADYWMRDFLNVIEKNDNVNNTSHILSLAKHFIVDQIPKEFGIEKAEKIAFLNKSINYFNENEEFNIKEFEKGVFEDSDIIKSFRKFGSSYVDDKKIDIADKFEISHQAVKKQARIFKGVLKLDKNFHIYIHGSNELIERGVEKDGRKYYKIYFNEEA